MSPRTKPVVGKRIDIRDPDGIWSSAAISAVQKRTIEIRYDGWDISWNEILPMGHPRLAPIYTYTSRLKCMVDLIAKPKHRGKGGKKSASSSMISCWPCILNTRMPDHGLQKAVALLEIEKNIFIQPYRPGLLPKYVRDNIRNGGIWWDVAHVKKWEPMDDSGKKKYHPNFKFAYETCIEDKSVPGFLKEDIFVKGSCVSETYRVKVGSKENSLVQLDGWEEDLVDFDVLNANVEAEEQINTSLSSQKKSAMAVSTEEGESTSAFHKELTTKRKRMEKDDTVESFVTVDSSDDEAVLERHARKRQNTPTTKLAAPAVDDYLPSPVQGIEMLYPGYDIQYSEITASWIASFDVGGNKIFVGQYPDQTQAKIAIDMAKLRLEATNQVQPPMTVEQQNLISPPQTLIQANNNKDDMNNYGLDQAVSLAYKSGAVSGNGFSMHNWTIGNIKNTAYDPRYQQNFFEMTRKQLMGRQKIIGMLNPDQNNMKNENRPGQMSTTSQQPLDQDNHEPRKDIGEVFRI